MAGSVSRDALGKGGGRRKRTKTRKTRKCSGAVASKILTREGSTIGENETVEGDRMLFYSGFGLCV